MSEQQTMPAADLPVDRPLEPRPRAIVIGASSGIGAALVDELARRGYVVAALARREEKLTAVCERANQAADSTETVVRAYVHDVTDFAAVPDLFAQIATDLGGVDLVVYNAGTMPAVGADEYNFKVDRKQIEVNLLGAMAWLNEAAVRFQRAGRGRIVGVGSVSGDRGRTLNPAYHTSKGGLAVYLESLRNRLFAHGVNVTTIKPGFVDTPMLAQAGGGTFWVISPQKAAGIIVDAAENDKQTVYVPGRWRLVMLIIRHIPSFIFRRMGI